MIRVPKLKPLCDEDCDCPRKSPLWDLAGSFLQGAAPVLVTVAVARLWPDMVERVEEDEDE